MPTNTDKYDFMQQFTYHTYIALYHYIQRTLKVRIRNLMMLCIFPTLWIILLQWTLYLHFRRFSFERCRNEAEFLAATLPG